MIADVVVHALLLGAMVSVCALAAERLVVVVSELRGVVPARRYVWLASMVICALVPLVVAVAPGGELRGLAEPGTALALGPQLSPETNIWRDAGVLLVDIARSLADTASSGIQATATLLASLLQRYNTTLLAAWIAASLALVIVVSLLALRLRAERRGWREDSLHDVAILLADDAGPAVVGLWKGRIVIPRWLLTLGAPLRELVLKHELEHVRARDAGALSLATVCLLIQPWNPALWWQFRRLRMAIEMDCDARVLRSGADVERYGLLLLAVGQRSGRSLTAVAALAEDRTLLARRIATMSAPEVSHPRTHISLWGAVGVAALLLACEVPDSNSPSAAASQPAPSAAVVAEGEPYMEFQVKDPVSANLEATRAPSYPADLRAAGISGTVLTQFVVDTDGNVELDSFKVVESDHEGFTEAVRAALPFMKFHPAQVEGKAVRQLVQQPFMFKLD